MNRTTTILLTATTSILLATPAHAGHGATPSHQRHNDKRPCVSLREFNQGGNQKILTRDEREAVWEVTGLGTVDPTVRTDGPLYGLIYPACGFGQHEAWVAVAYFKRNDHELLLERGIAEGATLHGHL